MSAPGDQSSHLLLLFMPPYPWGYFPQLARSAPGWLRGGCGPAAAARIFEQIERAAHPLGGVKAGPPLQIHGTCRKNLGKIAALDVSRQLPRGPTLGRNHT